MSKRTYTTEEKATFAAARIDAMDAMDAMILAGVEACRNSTEWQRWLRACSRFHSYSFGNVLLILSQRKDATQVAGFHTWRQLDRQVRKGETGIKILCPRRYRREDADGDVTTGIAGFSVGYVFDISQTDGADLPARPTATMTAGHDRGLLLLARTAAERLGCTVTTERPATTSAAAQGSYNPQLARIFIDPSYPPAAQAATLIHELAHHLMTPVRNAGKIDRATEEITVESAAYIVCQRSGIDTSSESFAYVAGWAGTRPAEEIAACLTNAQRVARQIIDTIDESNATAQQKQEA